MLKAIISNQVFALIIKINLQNHLPAGIHTVLLYLMLRAHFGLYPCPLFHSNSLFFKKVTKTNLSLMPSPHLETSRKGQSECRLRTSLRLSQSMEFSAILCHITPWSWSSLSFYLETEAEIRQSSFGAA